MSQSDQRGSASISFVGGLQLCLIVLKLIPDQTLPYGHHLIDWPWYWVLAPIWISLLLLIIAFILVITIAIKEL